MSQKDQCGLTEEDRQRIKREDYDIGTKLERCADLLLQLARCKKGEAVDMTGLGLWAIFCRDLEHVMDCRISPKYSLETM